MYYQNFFLSFEEIDHFLGVYRDPKPDYSNIFGTKIYMDAGFKNVHLDLTLRELPSSMISTRLS